MSNHYNDLAFEKIMEQVREDDNNGLLESEIFTYEQGLDFMQMMTGMRYCIRLQNKELGN